MFDSTSVRRRAKEVNTQGQRDREEREREREKEREREREKKKREKKFRTVHSCRAMATRLLSRVCLLEDAYIVKETLKSPTTDQIAENLVAGNERHAQSWWRLLLHTSSAGRVLPL